MKNYEILGGNLPVVVCELSAGESMITESGSMSWMSPNMKMETTTGGGVKKMLGRLVSGDSAFQNKFTAEGGDGTIAFASSFPGAIKALNISAGHSMIVQKSAFLPRKLVWSCPCTSRKNWGPVSLAAKASSCRN